MRPYEPGPLDDVIEAVMETGILQSPRRILSAKDGGHASIEGEILVEGTSVTLQVFLGPAFPLHLPTFVLKPRDALGYIPHVYDNGRICYADPEGMVLDRRRPVDIVLEAFARTMRTLSDGVTGRNVSHFADEFEWHWGRLHTELSALSVFDPTTAYDVRRIAFLFDRGKLAWIAGEERDVFAFMNIKDASSIWTIQHGIFIPLKRDTTIIPPRPDGPFWSAEEARMTLLSGLSENNRAQLQRLLKGRVHVSEYILANLPRPSGGDTLFGIRFDRVSERHPMLVGGSAERLVPIQISRLDRSYLVQRGGGDVELANKRVILAGCGAVGGHLAFELARAGISRLVLVDPDKLREDNFYRHRLGRQHSGEEKAEALKKEIEDDLPYVHVTAIVNTIEGADSAPFRTLIPAQSFH